jgi:hypothetical protein
MQRITLLIFIMQVSLQIRQVAMLQIVSRVLEIIHCQKHNHIIKGEKKGIEENRRETDLSHKNIMEPVTERAEQSELTDLAEQNRNDICGFSDHPEMGRGQEDGLAQNEVCEWNYENNR